MMTESSKDESNPDVLPKIPDKHYFTISEAATLCGLKSHILRYWEKEFAPLKQVGRRGNRRYYEYQDLMLLRTIKELVYVKGFTLEGARNYLQQSNKTSDNIKSKQWIAALTNDLQHILQILEA